MKTPSPDFRNLLAFGNRPEPFARGLCIISAKLCLSADVTVSMLDGPAAGGFGSLEEEARELLTHELHRKLYGHLREPVLQALHELERLPYPTMPWQAEARGVPRAFTELERVLKYVSAP